MSNRLVQAATRRFAIYGACLGLGVTVAGLRYARADDDPPPSAVDTPNEAGVLRTVTLDGSDFTTDGPFFQSFGTNGRTCLSCHVPSAAWSITPDAIRSLFDKTNGLDPVFQPVDGANSPLADVSTKKARKNAYSMLLQKGVIRVGRPMPANAEFSLIGVDDPWGYAGPNELSLFRRPLPTTNLRFMSAVMWDGRESSTLTGTRPLGELPPAADIGTEAEFHDVNLFYDLKHQGQDATFGHAQAMVPGLTDEEQAGIAEFELNLATAQRNRQGAGTLTAKGAQGGPEFLATVPFYVSMNDSSSPSLDLNGNPFNPASMTLFDAWASEKNPTRASIARGAVIFNNFVMNDAGVRCANCHGVPNVGNRSLNRMVNLNVSDAARRYAGLPLYTFQNLSTGETAQSTDPGLALTTGKWADIGKFKVPALRGLAARAPYFHNGMADTLDDVLNLYQQRFGLQFTEKQRTDLITFLKSL